MDPATIKKFEDAVLAQEMKTWGGPADADTQERVNRRRPIDMERLLGRPTQLVPHYRVDGGMCITSMLSRGVLEAQKLRLHEGDVLVSSYPKCGTTWIQEIAYLVMTNCDYETAKNTNLDERSPTLEYPECTFKTLQETPPPRVLKSHIPYSMLPGGDKKPYKIIYISRNPKDVAVSMFHFYKLIAATRMDGDLNDMLNMFLADSCIYAPFHKHALEFWEESKKGNNVLFIKYEDLHKDVEKEVRRVVEFMGKKMTDEQIEGIVRATSFQEMSAHSTKHHGQWEEKNLSDPSQKFMRKGKIGDWKLHFDDAMNERFEEYIRKHFGNSDLKYEYEWACHE